MTMIEPNGGIATETLERATNYADWSGDAATNWVRAQDLMDQLLEVFEARLTATVAGISAGRVLDIGCGTGTTTLAAARALGPRGDAVGLDISELMIDAARARGVAEKSVASFVLANAAQHEFKPGSFDLLISRFGVMFFQDNAAAFTHLHRAIRPGGGLHMITWRPPSENPFMLAAETAARAYLPDLPERKGSEPGQFGLCDHDAVSSMLTAAGWSGVELEPIDEVCTMTREQLDAYLVLLGPVGRVYQELEPALQTEVVAAVRAAFETYIDGDYVRFTAACWSIRATA